MDGTAGGSAGGVQIEYRGHIVRPGLADPPSDPIAHARPATGVLQSQRDRKHRREGTWRLTWQKILFGLAD